jgi:hypothetical protein
MASNSTCTIICTDYSTAAGHGHRRQHQLPLARAPRQAQALPVRGRQLLGVRLTLLLVGMLLLLLLLLLLLVWIVGG